MPCLCLGVRNLLWFCSIKSLLAFLSLVSTGLLELTIYQGGLKKKSYEVWIIISEQPVVSPMVSR